MSDLHITGEYEEFKFDITLKTGQNVLSGDSGIGKSFCFKFLLEYGSTPTNQFKVKLYNYTDMPKVKTIRDLDEHYDLIIFDNADLYLTKETTEQALLKANCVVVATRGCGSRMARGVITWLRIDRNGDKVVVKEVG